MKLRNLIFAALFFVSVQPSSVFAQNPNALKYEDFNVLAEVFALIESEYYKEVNMGECLQKILQGGVSNCTDHYSFYLDKEQTRLEDEERTGHFSGIGGRLGEKEYNGDKHIAVISVIKNSPAEKAGLRPGDFIVAVSSDGDKKHAADIGKMAIPEVVKLIRGEKGTPVFLKIFRGKELLEFNLVRDDIKLEIVSLKLLKSEVGYVKINEFSGKDFKGDFVAAASLLRARGVKVLLLDLRDNPGGALDYAIYVSELFRKNPDGDVVYKRPRNNEIVDVGGYSYLYSGKFKDLKVVILTNDGSASASEIVTAYLKNYCGAKVVGKNTYGKGIVQTLFPLKGGRRLHLTVAEYLVGPKLIPVHGIGIKPDFEVDNPAKVEKEEDDLQLKKAMEVAEEMLKQK